MGAGLVRYLASRALSGAAAQIQSVALGWIIFERTGNAFALGLVGLIWFLPAPLLIAQVGMVCDRYDRRLVVAVALVLQGLGGLALYLCVGTVHFDLRLAYLAVLATGIGRAFSTPAFQSLLPDLVEREALPRAVATASSLNQAATIVGPAIGGLIMAAVGGRIFLVLAAMQLIGAWALIGAQPNVREPALRPTNKSPWAGVAYVRSNRLLLGAMCLDLFTVILGGVTAILPIFAKDILHVGPFGLGLLRSAPAAGALIVGLALVRLPVQHRAGAILLWTVAGYGACTVVFGVSTLFWLSLAMMAALGGFDMVSVVIRQTLVQVATPEHMRGRVNAVNAVFVGASNQIGGFESGALASLIGAAGSAVVGGVGAIAVVVAIAWLFPEVRRADRLHEPALEEAALEPA